MMVGLSVEGTLQAGSALSRQSQVRGTIFIGKRAPPPRRPSGGQAVPSPHNLFINFNSATALRQECKHAFRVRLFIRMRTSPKLDRGAKKVIWEEG